MLYFVNKSRLSPTSDAFPPLGALEPAEGRMIGEIWGSWSVLVFSSVLEEGKFTGLEGKGDFNQVPLT